MPPNPTQNPIQYISSAPANVMLMGEHSVVYGQPALVASLTPRIQIEWTPRDDRQLDIISELAHFTTQLDQIKDHPKLRFVLAALKAFAPKLAQGWTLRIHSEFPDDWGLGSSAAVLAACLVGLENICQLKLSDWARFELGHRCILDVQGRGSGADLAASLTGGLVFFDPSRQCIQPIPVSLDLCLIYSGYKTPTSQVLAQVAKAWADRPEELQALYQKMGDTTRSAYQILTKTHSADDPAFYQQVTHYQQLMTQLGVSDPTLDNIVDQLRTCLPAAKISGSGLGDCVIGFGHIKALPPYKIMNARINSRPAECISQARNHHQTQVTL
ncbi:MAG: GHMP kinase [Thiomicrospira sp.]|uniref:mevalonate kinase family protein n=1 Tax=Thiomicrospira sp. TaxID=935 RepID=UPI001A0208AB|nr:GHMP kinase [Thiomicrospira sp.]MBE0494429.1 GHMP kinase [Thiomicrospira sp.]